MNNDTLSDLLAERLLGWRVTPDRYQMADRRWLPKWRFQPCKDIRCALNLLSAASVEAYTIACEKKGIQWAKVQLGGFVSEACDRSAARAISLALAQALQIIPGIDAERTHRIGPPGALSKALAKRSRHRSAPQTSRVRRLR
jgi:hypothetical protein